MEQSREAGSITGVKEMAAPPASARPPPPAHPAHEVPSQCMVAGVSCVVCVARFM